MRLFRRKQQPPAVPDAYDEAYLGLRSRALGLTAEELGDVAAGAPVIALLMEDAYPEAVATLVGVVDGSTSLYFSNGGGMIGAGEHAEVAEATARWLQVGADALRELPPVTSAPPPPPLGLTQFVAVTPRGLRCAGAGEDELGRGRHVLSPLFHAAHDVITQIRLLDERPSE